VTHGSPLAAMTEGENEVTHGSPLVPWSAVERLLNISKRHRIRLTAVLALSEQAQRLVIEHGLSERLIRPIVEQLKDSPARQLAALAQVVQWQREGEQPDAPARPLVAATQALAEQLAQESATEQPTPPAAVGHPAKSPGRSPSVKSLYGKVQGTLRFLDRLPDQELSLLTSKLATSAEFDEVVGALESLRLRLDALLAAVKLPPPP
jgi:hypothetical protein